MLTQTGQTSFIGYTITVVADVTGGSCEDHVSTSDLHSTLLHHFLEHTSLCAPSYCRTGSFCPECSCVALSGLWFLCCVGLFSRFADSLRHTHTCCTEYALIHLYHKTALKQLKRVFFPVRASWFIVGGRSGTQTLHWHRVTVILSVQVLKVVTLTVPEPGRTMVEWSALI